MRTVRCFFCESREELDADERLPLRWVVWTEGLYDEGINIKYCICPECARKGWEAMKKDAIKDRQVSWQPFVPGRYYYVDDGILPKH